MPRFPSPLGGAAPPEVLLTRSPLVRVLAQARFSSVLVIDAKSGVAKFQDRIRGKYPLLEEIASQQMQVGIGGGFPTLRSTPSTIWRFSDAERTVQLSLTTDSATLEALTYEGRNSFLLRWSEILTQIEQEFSPSLALRTGVRYVNRVSEPMWLERLPEFVRPSFVGVIEPDFLPFVSNALNEAVIGVAEGSLVLHWGIMPPNMTIDPNLLVPSSERSWIFDIDAFSDSQRKFEADDLTRLFRNLSERAYSVFRYVVTTSGLEFFGT